MCTPEPPVIDRATLTYYPDVVPTGPADTTTAPAATTADTTTAPAATTADQVCTDDDAAVIALAASQNVTIAGCGDTKVKRACSKFTMLLTVCCVTCQDVVQDTAGGVAPAKALSGNPFADTSTATASEPQMTSTHAPPPLVFEMAQNL